MQFLKAGLKPLKSIEKAKTRQAHTSPMIKGMGDHYGSGIRAKIGRMRDGMGMKDIDPAKLKTPPRSVA